MPDTKHPPMFVHSCYTNNGYDDAVVVKEIIVDENGNPEPHLNVIRNPKRRYWITKPPYRTHKYTKEFADIEELEEYTCEQKELERSIVKTLNGWVPRRRLRIKDVCNSPYVYGADINIECLIKHRYMELYGDRLPHKITMGFLDIETSTISDDGEIILITVMHEEQVYTAIHDAYLWKNIDPKKPDTKRERASLEDVKRVVHETLKPYTDEHGFTYNFYIGKDQVELITWIWDRIHENKTDFVGIWNIDFDIPKIIEALNKASVELTDVLCHPDVPIDLRKVWYKQDKRDLNKVAHFTEKWHWLHTTGYTQVTDCQNLYSRLRKVKGYKESYKLNDILFDELGERKLSLGPEQSHPIMQRYRFLDYIAYNIFDCIGLYLLEKKNQDHESMYILSGSSPYSQYAYQTIMLANMLYHYCLEHGKVLGTAGSKMANEFTKLIKSAGGTVLPPERKIGIGVNAILERPTFETLLYAHSYDSDFSAYYPRTQMGANIATETKVCTTVGIDGELNHLKVHDLFSRLISLDSNAVDICEEYLNLPNYETMERLVLNHLNSN